MEYTEEFEKFHRLATKLLDLADWLKHLEKQPRYIDLRGIYEEYYDLIMEDEKDKNPGCIGVFCTLLEYVNLRQK